MSASVVGVTRAQGGVPKYFTRSAAAAQFFEDVCAGDLAQLTTESQANGGVFGTNRVRAEKDGPIRGRLLAVALRDAQGTPLGTLIAGRLPEEPKFVPRDSRNLLAFAPRFVALLQTPAGASSSAHAEPHAPASGHDRSASDPPKRRALATLLGWTEFERTIRIRESMERLPGCVLYGDIDQLHVLNKLAGFAAGDQAISLVGSVLQTIELPAGSCACHLSGDRYTVYVPSTTLAQAMRVAELITQRVSSLSIPVQGVPTRLSISFGAALIPANEGGLSHALAAAEAACKAAKDRGRGRVEVYQDADQSIVRRNDDVLVADRLRHALQDGRFDVFVQPIVRLNGDDAVSRHEVLVRLIGEGGAYLSPTWFMSAATRYRMLIELDRAVIGHVLQKLEAQRAMLTERKMRFSVNLSGPTIGDADFLEWLASRIGGAGVPGDCLQFEITETAAVANIAQTQAMIRRLRARGVRFALDDFGTGVSSFAYLKFLDVQMLKLDGAFVRDLLSNPRAESLVRGIAQLGRGMNIETVAECVETEAVRVRLTELGIDCAQGFLFGKPRPIDELLARPGL
ncbi:MAG: EAL domain-containing protein [Steroidobacteraceae bacterium]|nr:EAL domain-containing protein [Steroidobacteraceae bacterium]